MTEVQRIKAGISKKPKQAYLEALKSGSACVLNSDNTVVLVQKDGTKKPVIKLKKTRVRVKQSIFLFR